MQTDNKTTNETSEVSSATRCTTLHEFLVHCFEKARVRTNAADRAHKEALFMVKEAGMWLEKAWQKIKKNHKRGTRGQEWRRWVKEQWRRENGKSRSVRLAFLYRNIHLHWERVRNAESLRAATQMLGKNPHPKPFDEDEVLRSKAWTAMRRSVLKDWERKDLETLQQRCIGFKSRGKQHVDFDPELALLLAEGLKPALRRIRMTDETKEEKRATIAEVLKLGSKLSQLRWAAQREVLEPFTPYDLLPEDFLVTSDLTD